jgi:hypothetical protein
MLFLASHGYRCISPMIAAAMAVRASRGTATTWTPMPTISRSSFKSSILKKGPYAARAIAGKRALIAKTWSNRSVRTVFRNPSQISLLA